MARAKVDTEEKKLDRRSRKTVEALKKAFHELLTEKPLKKITVTEIADRADLDRKTFYLHYGSIEDLVDDVLREHVEMMASRLGEATVNDDGEIDVSGLYQALAVELAPSIEEGKAILTHVDIVTLVDRVEPLLVSAIIENDSFGLANKFGPYLDYFATFYCAGALATFRRWVESDSEIPMENLAELAGSAVSSALNELIARADASGGHVGYLSR